MAGRVDDRLARRGGVVELLRGPALLFGVAARLRAALYDRRLLAIKGLDTPVVCVGNLTAGGTGKTPMVAWVVGALAERGLHAGILSRGYGRGADGENDEARLLARALPGVPHVQDPDRVAGGERLQQQGVDVIVLDDGFQHRRLARDLDLVLVDATRPWGLPAVGEGEPVRAFLPRGLLREPPTALARADAVVITRADGVGPERLASLRRELAGFAGEAPFALACHAPVGLRGLDGEERGTSHLEGLEVDLLSGLGNPAAFEATVCGLGARVVEHRALPDHHPFVAGDLVGLGARPLVITTKDEPKLRPVISAGTGAPFEVWVLDIELRVTEGEQHLQRLLANLPEAQARRERDALHGGLHG
jgi:tetraacyldisaccharide 4'-kinase